MSYHPEPEKYIKLRPAEIQSGLDRVRLAEMLIRQLHDAHDGRNTWLLNYGGDRITEDHLSMHAGAPLIATAALAVNFSTNEEEVDERLAGTKLANALQDMALLILDLGYTAPDPVPPPPALLRRWLPKHTILTHGGEIERRTCAIEINGVEIERLVEYSDGTGHRRGAAYINHIYDRCSVYEKALDAKCEALNTELA